MTRTTAYVLAVLAAALTAAGCAGSGRFVSPEPVPDDRRAIAKPESRDINVEAYYLDQQVFRQFEDMIDLSRGLRWISGNRKEAMNVDAFDEVANSSWFSNRNATRRMSVEEIRRGPDTVDGPDLSSTLEVFRAKSQGVTPGFQVIDPRGDRYVIKFDPPGHPGLITGAEVVSTKLFYAAGYHTPENFVVDFDPAILVVGDKVKFTDERARRRNMTGADLAKILERVPREPDGTVRALASKYVDGQPIGPFRYDGTRDDDPNDIIPHQHRRELRGLRVIAAWLDHFDTKAGNSLDSYVTVDGQSYVRHYLIDFGSTLGAGAEGPAPTFRGHENDFDPHAIAFNTITLGLYVRPYERREVTPFPSVGRWDANVFNPQEYKFETPNPAFENMTHRDAFWAAKIVMSFTDAQIDAAVEEGKYPDPEAAAYVARVIRERRDVIGRYYFARVNPLDRFELKLAGQGVELRFADLAVEAGLESAADTRYRATVLCDGDVVSQPREVAGPVVPLDDVSFEAPDSQWEVRVETRRGEGGWSGPVGVFIAPGPNLLGLRR